MLTKIIVQIVGQCCVAALAFYWLGLGVGSTLDLALNALVALLLVFALALLDAYGAGNWRHVLWALPAVLVMGLLWWGVKAALLVALLWLAFCLPTAARGQWTVYAKPRYLAMGLAILALSLLPAVALLGWTPKLEGLAIEMTSFLARTALAAIFVYGGWAVLLDFVRRETTLLPGQATAPPSENPLPAHPPQQPANL
jgi:hypothetical protein